MSHTRVRPKPAPVVVIAAVNIFDNLPMTQVALADQMGVQQATVSRWANGKSSLTVGELRKVEAVCREKVFSVLSDLNLLKSALNELEKSK